MKNILMLIDAENIACNKIPLVIDHIKTTGKLVRVEAFADWRTPSMQNWKSTANKNNIAMNQQSRYVKGKGTSDFGLIIEAMDKAYRANIDTFVIVSSDSDFVAIVKQLKSYGKEVIGVGEYKSFAPYARACSEFIFIEDLSKPQPPESTNRDIGTVSYEQITQYKATVNRYRGMREVEVDGDKILDIKSDTESTKTVTITDDYTNTEETQAITGILEDTTHSDLQYIIDVYNEKYSSVKIVVLTEFEDTILDEKPHILPKNYGFDNFKSMIMSILGVNVVKFNGIDHVVCG